jgi:hypothetical protein
VRPIDASDPAQRIAHKAGLGFELSCVFDMLKLAAAAVAEVPANGFSAVRRGFYYFLDNRARELLFSFDEPDPHTIAGRAERDKDYEPIKAGDRVAAVGQPLDRQLDYVSG